MKKTTLISLLALAILAMPLSAFAEDAAALYTAKCKACHGADGKKLAKADLTAPAIQGKTDDALIAFLTSDAKHKAKAAADAKALVTYLRTLKK